MNLDITSPDILIDEPSWTLIIADSSGKPIRQISLLERTKLTVGRSTERDLILDDPKVSRLHCVLYQERGEWCVVDAESAGGTYVDGQRVLWKRLHNHRAVQIGDMKMWVRQSPLPTVDPALNRSQVEADNNAKESEAEPFSPPGDTIIGMTRGDDDEPLPLYPDPPTSEEMASEGSDDEAALERTSIFLRDADDFVDAAPPLREPDQQPPDGCF